MMERKAFKLTLKQIQDDGTFTGYAAVFDIVDNGKDLIQKGAFTKTLMEKKTFPLFWAHNGMKIPVGDVTAEQDDFGLKVDGLVYVNDFEGKPLEDPRQLHMSLKRRSVMGMSIGYDAVAREFRDDIRILKEVKLYEVSFTPWPMNDLAQVTDVKSIEPGGIIEMIQKMEGDERFSTPEAKAKILEARKALDALLGGQPEETTDDAGKPQDTAGEPGPHSLEELKAELIKFKSLYEEANKHGT
jgi:HK97 family phage prohead protease